MIPSQRICLSRLFWGRSREGPETTAKTANTSSPHGARLHIGKLLCCWPLMNLSFHSTLSAISCTLKSVEQTAQRRGTVLHSHDWRTRFFFSVHSTRGNLRNLRSDGNWRCNHMEQTYCIFFSSFQGKKDHCTLIIKNIYILVP